jgi:hypothetical protein
LTSVEVSCDSSLSSSPTEWSGDLGRLFLALRAQLLADAAQVAGLAAHALNRFAARPPEGTLRRSPGRTIARR